MTQSWVLEQNVENNDILRFWFLIFKGNIWRIVFSTIGRSTNTLTVQPGRVTLLGPHLLVGWIGRPTEDNGISSLWVSHCPREQLASWGGGVGWGEKREKKYIRTSERLDTPTGTREWEWYGDSFGHVRQTEWNDSMKPKIILMNLAPHPGLVTAASSNGTKKCWW